MDSGSVFLISTKPDKTYTNFTFVARHFGCNTSNPETELSCMRGIDFQAITDFVGGYGENKTSSEPALSFLPTLDERIVFSNYTDRYRKGLLSDRPAIFTSNKDEGTMFVATLTSVPSSSNPYGTWSINTTVAEQTTLSLFQCPAARSIALREAAGRKTYRWQYAGNFSNVSPLPWQGAYHSADLAMLFGSHPDFRGQSTPEEYATSESMQDHLLAFVRDPVNGPGKIGWEDSTSGQLLRFGTSGEVVTTIREEEVDGACNS
jgi:acetylcholinesterase